MSRIHGALALAFLVSVGAVACGSSDEHGSDAGAGDGRASSGGTSASTGGNGNVTSTGGAQGRGGAAMGGSPGTGGTAGTAGTGGAKTGGTTGRGGAGGGAGGRGGSGGRGSGGRAGTGGGAGGAGDGSGGSAGRTGAGGSGMASSGCGKSSPTGNRVLTIQVAGQDRTFLLSVPTGYSKAAAGPLYFVFHGYGGNHDAVLGLGFEQKYVSVFPDGLPREGAPSGWDESPSSTDVTMFDQVLAAVSADYCIDSKKVYVAGFSWGGWMATALACVRGDVVSGFASVEGGVLNSSRDCKGPVAGWVNHYKDDPTEPYSSGTHEVTFFTALNVATNPMSYDAPNPCMKYDGKAPFVFCNPEGALHQWPDYATAAIERFFGTP